jgi:hypothetical protein
MSHTTREPLPAHAAPSTYTYTSGTTQRPTAASGRRRLQQSQSSGFTYILNTTATTAPDAAATCNSYGGQLVAYRSLAEQQEVESYYQELGVLLPTFHKQYWVGLVTNNQSWPIFNWRCVGLIS